jgi:putative colanic acid biosynthesis UDP-glucose lipid carrier transferase
VSVQEQFAQARDALPILTDSFGLARPLSVTRPAKRTRPLYAAAKRVLDLLIAVPALLFVAPLLLIVALLIRRDSRGPAMFRQTRLGLNGRPFHILKFRTMNVLENGEEVVQVERNDARITRVGAFLRATSIDELPQLLNVISGDMSLVGPRPHAIAHDMHYAALIPEYELRQSVKPGITGWAQVNGHRGGTPKLSMMQRRVDFDLWYAGHASVLLDMLIIVRTPIELLRNRSVY